MKALSSISVLAASALALALLGAAQSKPGGSAPPAKPAAPPSKAPSGGGASGDKAPLRAFGPTVQLFDGKTLKGWKMFLPNGADPAKTWSVSDGAITCEGKPNGYIQTDKDYESFELELDWRFDPKKGAGNSGVLLRVSGEDKVWPKSVEAQLNSGDAGDIYNIDFGPIRVDAKRTSATRTQKMEASSEKPLGEWNHYRILLDKGHLELWVNGKLQNTADDIPVVAGRIALQSEGAFIQFKDIKLRPITKG